MRFHSDLCLKEERKMAAVGDQRSSGSIEIPLKDSDEVNHLK